MIRMDSQQTEYIEIYQNFNMELEKLSSMNIELLYVVMIAPGTIHRKLNEGLICIEMRSVL